MVTTASILITAGLAETAECYRALVESAGGRAEVCRPGEAIGRMQPGSACALVLDEQLLDAAGPELLRAAAASDTPVILGVGPRPDQSQFDTAARSGCLELLSTAATAASVSGMLARLSTRREARSVIREECRRLRFQSDELRRRCAQQAERFQETQDTFFLDLSRMMTIITNIMDGIVFIDRAGNVTLMNPVAEDLLGTKSFVAIGKPMGLLQGRRDLVQTLVEDHARLSTQKEVVQTVELHHSEQDLLYIKCITTRVLDYRGQPAGILTVLKDVTAEFKTDQLKNQYLSIVAHELRTPLTGIKTFATMMAKGTLGALTDRQQRVCDSIREQSLRLEHQIDKLINLGNLESADYGRDREVITVEEFTTGLFAPFEQPARDRHIELTVQIDDTDEKLFADRADLRRACQALVENAVKFTRDGGQVRVRIEAMPEGGLRFGVSDDGIGIDPRYHRRIFEKFFQVEDPLTRHHGGAGLGLFVTRGIVEAHGSRIEVSSQLGQGADFSFALPLLRQMAHSTPDAGVST